MRLRAPAAVPCALATHALLYRSFWPADGAHGYLGWYQPAVAALSAASVLALIALVGLSRVARARLRVGDPRPLGESARGLAAASLAVLLVQESVERTVASGHPAVALFTPSQWLVLLAGIALTSLTVALALRAGHVAARRLLGGVPALRAPAPAWSVVTVRAWRPRPLAERFGLRAPPALVG
jgi:hypothetical protein